MPLPNFIIAGPPKAGTTSVFRYLAAHPDVSPSSIKEIHFFEKYLGRIDHASLELYRDYFKSATTEKIILEASPRYMQCGLSVAEAIHNHLPESKVAFILREPVDRFLSRFISLITKTERISQEHKDLDNLVDAALADPQAAVDVTVVAPRNEIVEYLWQGAYAPYLSEYLSRFPKEQVGLFYFDTLKDNPREFMECLSRFLDIDASFYRSFEFNIENKTRTVRFPAIHKLAESTNRRLERFQNRFPRIRKSIRSAYYNVLNRETDSMGSIDTRYASARLREYYSLYNDDLAKIMTQYSPDKAMPSWLAANSSEDTHY